MRIETELRAIYTKYGVEYINLNKIVKAVPIDGEYLIIYMDNGQQIKTKNVLFRVDEQHRLILY